MSITLFVDRNGFYFPEDSANRVPEVVIDFKRYGQQLEIVSQHGSANVDIARAKAFVMKKAA